jgi:tRNA pseudouridine38-40 synthase
MPAMTEAIRCVVGEKNFSAFQGVGCDARHSIRRVLFNGIERKNGLILYTVEATAFLRHMVRNIVGTLCLVGAGNRTPEAFQEILKGGDRTKAGGTAPARGLFLMGINY